MAGGSLIGLLLLEFHLDIVIVISVTLVRLFYVSWSFWCLVCRTVIHHFVRVAISLLQGEGWNPFIPLSKKYQRVRCIYQFLEERYVGQH
jgi:hypothetical protein